VAGSTGTAGGAVLESVCDAGSCIAGTDGWGALVVLIGFAVGIVAWALFVIIRAGHRHFSRKLPSPKGAWLAPSLPRGRIRQARVLTAIGRTRGLILECKRAFGSRVMLRDGRTGGLTLQLDDGSSVHIPAGPLRVEGPAALADHLTPSQVAPFLRRVDPLRDQRDALSPPPPTEDPIPWERALEINVKEGDRVELCGELDWEPDPQQPGGGYRSAPATIAVPRGPCLLRLVVQS